MEGTMFIGVKEAAEVTGLSYEQMLEISKRRDAPTLPIGKSKVMFLASALEDYMTFLVDEHMNQKKGPCAS